MSLVSHLLSIGRESHFAMQAETVSYVTAGDDPRRTLMAILGEIGEAVSDTDSGRVLVQTRHITFRLADLPSANRGDKVTDPDGAVWVLDTIAAQRVGDIVWNATNPIPIDITHTHYRNRL